ncbi:uncharacterized protein Triagg1_4520 [Trichoderma aggressivum f. europaeum]|uniref:Uncharacterized protein n=1 Tax=Trichoderma aggressivum f. europaeum TaxID=173218 RepID=A0AAE1IFR3_9HYPO|nr:hypothetical protein Triagg1_4520 [Trichoderma aggressivum f. europaeum]
MSLSATTLERPGSSAFGESAISCDHEKRDAEGRGFVMRARVDDEMGRSAERERFPALVASETRARNENKEEEERRNVANSRRLPPEWPTDSGRLRETKANGWSWGSERVVAGEKREHAKRLLARLILCRFPLFLETDRSVYSGRLQGAGRQSGPVGITSFGLYRARVGDVERLLLLLLQVLNYCILHGASARAGWVESSPE